jgi:hypothetical protein
MKKLGKLVKESLNEAQPIGKGWTVQDIVDNTRNAHSYGYYGPELWKEIIAFLLAEGYPPLKIKNILRSELMKNAYDFGVSSLDEFKEWFLSENELKDMEKFNNTDKPSDNAEKEMEKI